MKSIEIINKRETLDKEIAKLWNNIYTENVVDGKVTRNFDLKDLLKQIEIKSTERIDTKLYSLMINLGVKSVTEFYKLFPDTLYPTIYTLSEKRELYVKLGKIPTLKTAVKVKLGKKNLAKTEVITEGFIKMKRETLQLEINALEKKLLDFNENAILITTVMKKAA